MGEFLRRINVVQEWTVEAAVSGDRTLVLEAMMADPMAGQLAYDDIVDHDRRDARRHGQVAAPVLSPPRFSGRVVVSLTPVSGSVSPFSRG